MPRLGDLLDANGYKITNLPDPLTDQEAATKAYVDARAAGMDPKGGCASVSLANVALTGTQTIQGVALTATQRVLLTAQTAPAENGPWVVASGSWTRPVDFAAASTQHPGAYCMIEAGNYAGHGFIMTGTTDVTVGTTAQTWVEFTGAADISVTSPIQKSGNTISLGTVPVANGGTGGTDAATAKTNLGFMSRYAADVGDGSNSVYTITHSLGTLDVVWQVYKKSDGVDELVSAVRTSTSVLTLTFGAVIATNSYRVVVMG